MNRSMGSTASAPCASFFHLSVSCIDWYSKSFPALAISSNCLATSSAFIGTPMTFVLDRALSGGVALETINTDHSVNHALLQANPVALSGSTAVWHSPALSGNHTYPHFEVGLWPIA